MQDTEDAPAPPIAAQTPRPRDAQAVASPPAEDAAAGVPPVDGAGPPAAEPEHLRLEWDEGPDESTPGESWLSLDDDDLLLRIESVGAEEDEDDRLLEVVESHRHFFVRQEAAKRVRERPRLFAYEDDRHVGQILVRHLTRREDLTYLERLSMRSRHVEVRKAAQVQLARVWRRVEARQTGGHPAVKPGTLVAAEAPASATLALAPARAATTPAIETNVPVDGAGVDASLLGWAAHFIVEQAWSHLGTTAARELLKSTHAGLLGSRPGLGAFTVSPEARVTVSAAPGERMARSAVADLAHWMVAFRAAAREVTPDLGRDSVRAATSLMADALREVGFYAECDAAEGGA